MSERDTRRHVIQALKAAWLDPHPVENRCEVGMPDIECLAGWIECKYRPNWPAREDSVVTLHHPITPGQRIWMQRRTKLGGRVYVLLQVSSEWLLFRGADACSVVGSSTRQQLYAATIGRWSSIPEMSHGLPACLNRLTC